MHRKPEPTAAAKLLTQAFAAQGVELKHQAALNLLATLEGFESYAHMKAAQAAVPVTNAEGPVERPFKVRYLFGQEEVHAYHHANDDGDEEDLAQALSEVREFCFATEIEMYAFMDGVEAGGGALEYLNVTDETS